jgi:hypothetical protein
LNGTSASRRDAESLVAELRVRSHEDHIPTGGALKFTRPEGGQKLKRYGMVQIADDRVPDLHIDDLENIANSVVQQAKGGCTKSQHLVMSIRRRSPPSAICPCPCAGSWQSSAVSNAS